MNTPFHFYVVPLTHSAYSSISVGSLLVISAWLSSKMLFLENINLKKNHLVMRVEKQIARNIFLISLSREKDTKQWESTGGKTHLSEIKNFPPQIIYCETFCVLSWYSSWKGHSSLWLGILIINIYSTSGMNNMEIFHLRQVSSQ